MSYKPFQHAHAKVARARKHIADLEAGAVAFLAQKPHVAIIAEERLGPNGALGTKYHLQTYCVVGMPADFPLVLGDATHNLRVALDVLANDAVALSNTIPKGVYFPFGKDPAHLEGQINEKLKGATPDTKDLVRSLKPYPGGNDALRALHDLDIQDKHIAPLDMANTITTPGAQMRDGRLDYSQAGLEPLDRSILPGPLNFPPTARVLGMSRDFDCQVILAKGMPMSGKPVIGVLNELSELVEGVIETFEAHLLRSKSSRPAGE